MDLWERSIIIFLVAGLSFSGQKEPAKQQGLVLRSTTRLVEVSVVVQDKKGNFIRDLKKEDFVLLENGKPQQIRVFFMQAKNEGRLAAEELPLGTFSNRYAERPGTRGGVTVILIDCLNTSWGDQVTARSQILNFLQQIQPNDRVALYALTRQLRVLHDFTRDPAPLVRALRAFQGIHMPDLAASVPSLVQELHNQATASAQSPEEAAAALEAIQGIINALKEEAFNAEKTRILVTLGALEAIANHLAGVPGRKNLVWVSGGFPLLSGYLEATDDGPGLNTLDSPYSAKTASSRDIRGRRTNIVSPPVQFTKHGRGQTFSLEFQRAVRALNAASLAVYPVDARGLSTNPNVWANISTMKDLAADTGGKAYYNRNDVNNSVREAITDSEVSYTLAYYPRELSGDGSYHSIKVKVARPGVVVRHRRGYYDFPEPAPGEPLSKDLLQQTLWSPLDATGLPLEVRAQRNGLNEIILNLKLDPGKLSLEPQAGARRGEVFVFVSQTDDQGREFKNGSQLIQVVLRDEDYQSAVERGLHFRTAVRMEPLATTLRVVVRDPQSGAMGRVLVPANQIP